MASCCMAEPWSAVPEWMAKAEGDWEALEILLTRNTPGLRDAVVFHAQQCVEKLLKARLIQLGHTVDKIHDPAILSRQLEAVDGQWSWDGEELADLSSGAVLARYPGFKPQPRNRQNRWNWPAT
ncbi:MAG: DNA-binding protein [Cyanobium sp.]|nr:MAG: DNA-binding protein [Cyanobium sp.]